MAQPINETLKFRQRGYKMADGTIQQVFGNDSPALNPDGSMPEVQWDHDVVSQTTVSPHVDPAPSAAV